MNCKNCGAPIKSNNNIAFVCAYCKTRYEPERQIRNVYVNTGGGTYTSGNVNTGGGDFIGRNKTTVIVSKR